MNYEKMTKAELISEIKSLKANMEIAKRKRIEEKLSNSEQNYRNIFKNAMDGIVTGSLQGNFVTFNDAFVALTGYSKEELLNMRYQGLTPPEYHDMEAEKVKILLETGEPQEYEKEYIRKDGTRVPLLLKVSAIYDDDGKPKLLMAVVKDMTKIKRSEEELKKNHNLLQAIIEGTNDVAFVIDLQGRYIMMNSVGTNYLNIPLKEVIGKTNSELFPPETAHKITENNQTVITSGKTMEFVEPLIINGNVFTFFSRKAPYRDSKGKIIGVVGITRDITESKKMEEKLRKSEENLNHAQKITHIGSWEWDVVKNETICSDEHYRIHGLEPQQYPLVYEKFLELVHADDREFVIKSITGALYEGKTYSIDFRIVRPDGSERIVHSEAEVKFDETGKPLRMIGTEQDITERKQAEDELCKQSSYCKLLGTAAISPNEAVEIKDAFQLVLKEICSYTGWEIGHAYVISKDDPNLLEPTSVWWLKEHKHFKEFCNVSKEIKFAKGIDLPGRVLASRKPHWIVDVTKDKNFLRKRIAKDLNIKSGIAFPVMVGTKVVAVMTFFTTKALEPDQRFMEIMAYVGTQLGRAVERKQAEEILLKSEERCRSLINDVLDTSKNVGVFILDKEFRVVWINKALESYFGLKRDEVIMKNKRQLIKDKIRHIFKDGDKFKERVLKTYDDNTYVENFVCHILPGDGREERWLEHWSLPIVSGLYAGGRVEHYTDITKRKLAEDALLQSEKMKAMGIITAGVAHEFNNILTIISGNAQFLKEKYRDDKELAKAIRTICRVADDGAQIVERMDEFTNVKIDTSQYMLVNMMDLIKQAIDFTMPRWKNMAQNNGIIYYIDVKDLKKVPEIFGNPSELREVLVNIINNALDAMPAGGHISFHTWKKDESVFISITDTGKGMSEDVKKMIFDPFFTTRSPEGTGLGMSVTYGIIARHGGKINIESEVGKGSVITISLPTATKSIFPVVSPKPTRAKKAKNLNVLVVDDEQDICEFFSNSLTKEGHNVETVDNGAKAIKLLKNNTYDLLICDLVMPEVTGMDVLKSLDSLDKRPKVGIITGWKYKIKDLDVKDLNVDFIVKKPFKLTKLRRDINNIFCS
jgi:PAS domain S-box-containing protein